MASHLYILQCEHFFKIGCTNTSVKARVRSMTTGNPFHINIALDVMLEGEGVAYDVEQLLHEKYSKKRGLGEWFMLSNGDIEDIKEYVKTHESFKKMTVGHFSEIPAFDSKKSYWRDKYMSDIQKLSRIEKDYYWRTFNFEKWVEGMRESFRKREGKISVMEVSELQRKKQLEAEIEELEKKIHEMQGSLDYYECHISLKEKYLEKLSQHPLILALTKEVTTIKGALKNISKIQL